MYFWGVDPRFSPNCKVERRLNSRRLPAHCQVVYADEGVSFGQSADQAEEADPSIGGDRDRDQHSRVDVATGSETARLGEPNDFAPN